METKQEFFGTKRIIALAMTRQQYNDYRGWSLPADEDGADAGFLVEYTDDARSNHPGHAGYISWSPADVFEAAYQSVDALSFGHAIEAMKAGHRVARGGWNGKGMFLVLVAGTPQVAFRDGTPYRNAGIEVADIAPHIDMFTAQGQFQPGWLASQTDMLANDWQVVGQV